MIASRRHFLRNASCLAALAGFPPGRNADCAADGVENARIGGGDTSTGMEKIRAQFPALSQEVDGRPLIYLDSAATTQRPAAVIEAMNDYYGGCNANPSPSLHSLARRSATLYEGARQTVARFVNARAPEEIVFTRGTTEAINLAASSWGSANLRPGDEIILTTAEHYSNLLPWQLAAGRVGTHLKFMDVDSASRLRLDQFDSLLSPRTRLVAFPHVSNVLGRINPAKELCEKAHRAGALALIDAAQSVPHFPIDVQTLGCDFLAFSGHKMAGPMGIGVLWARREILQSMPPYQSGSNMTHEADLESAPGPFGEGSHKFEAGTPNVAGAVGLAAAVQFLESLGRSEIWKRERELTRYALAQFHEVEGLRILGPTDPEDRISVFSFVLENLPALDLARALDTQGIAVRAGDLAASPLLKRMGVSAAVRASCYLYSQPSEVDVLVKALKEFRKSGRTN